jgi:hypothetical protein
MLTAFRAPLRGSVTVLRNARGGPVCGPGLTERDMSAMLRMEIGSLLRWDRSVADDKAGRKIWIVVHSSKL